jgi:hypothetical protein
MKSLLAAALLAFMSAPLVAAETVAGLVETYDHLRLGLVSPVKDVSWTHEHLKISMSGGFVAPVYAGEEMIGVFLSGNGLYQLTSVDPAEAAVMETNVKRATGLSVTKAGEARVIQDSFERAFLWTRNVQLPAVPADGSEPAHSPTQAAFEAQRELFARERETVSSFVFVKSKLDDSAKPLVRAEFSGGKENAVYLYDPVITHTEKLHTLHGIKRMQIREYQKSLFPIVLSEQRIGFTRHQFVPPPFFLTGVDYTLTATGNDATLSVAETIVPTGSAQRVFRFNQTSSDYDSNLKRRVFNVVKVTDAKGTPLSFVHREDELLVGVPVGVPVETEFQIRFEIEGDFLIRPSGDSYWELGTSAWFPQPEMNGQFYSIHSTVRVKKPFVPFAPGETVRRVVEGDYNVVENRVSKPVQFAVVLAGRYTFEDDTRDGLTIRVASYANNNQAAMKKLANLAHQIITFYTPFLGPFPFKEFNIIEINDYGFGQAPPATMFITKEAFNPMAGEENQRFSEGINHRFAHEVAHQYWGHVVKMGSAEEQWITESFAEYSSSYVIELMKGKGGKKAMVNRWRANANDSKNASSIALANRLRDFDDPTAFEHRTNLVYDKGAYVLWKLHEEIGDKPFLLFLRNVQGMKAWRFATTSEFAPLLKRITDKDYAAFFEKYYWGTAMP